jgi:hypothetical protein
MRFQVITVPVHHATEALEELNTFVASHRVISVDRQLVLDGPRSDEPSCVCDLLSTCDPGVR